MSCMSDRRAAACTSFAQSRFQAVFGFTSTPMAVALGTIWRSSSSRFAPDVPLSKDYAGDVAARPIEAGDEAVLDRVAAGREDDRYRRGRSFGREHGNGVSERSRPPAAESDRPPRPATDPMALRRSEIRSRHSGPRQSLLPSSPGGTRSRGSLRRRATRCETTRSPASPAAARAPRAATRLPRRQDSAMNSRRLIRSPRRRVASSVGGTVRPSALAVLRLITNSNLVDCMTGRSAGFSPLRIRPA